MHQDCVVFAGDSLTDQWATLSCDFPLLNAVNRGISGDTSTALLRRFRSDVLACNPRVIVILIGTNDLADGVRPARVAACLRRILGLTAGLNGGIPVILCRLPPRKFEPGKFPGKILELNLRIDRFASTSKRITVCDTFTPFATLDGGCHEADFTDGLHLSNTGYRKLTALLTASLARYLSGFNSPPRGEGRWVGRS